MDFSYLWNAMPKTIYNYKNYNFQNIFWDMGNISHHFDSETKWSTFGMYSEKVRKSHVWRNSWHSFIRKKKMVYCVAVTCNNSLRGECVSYFWVTPTLFILDQHAAAAKFVNYYVTTRHSPRSIKTKEIGYLSINAYFRNLYREFLRN